MKEWLNPVSFDDEPAISIVTSEDFMHGFSPTCVTAGDNQTGCNKMKYIDF